MGTSPTGSIGMGQPGTGTEEMTMAAERGKWIKACDTSACVEVLVGNRHVLVTGAGSPDILRFTHEEWDEFVQGVKAGKFDTA